MNCKIPKRVAIRAIKRRRGATSVLEVIVALTLLLSVLSLSVSLILRHGHLLTAQRHYRQALDELSNQMDRVTALPADEVPQALKQLSLSPFAVARLSAAKLSADLKPGDMGRRITMRLTWKESHEQIVSMTGWIFPQIGPPAKKTGGEP